MIRSKRKKPRPGRCNSVEIYKLKLLRYAMDGGKCQRCDRQTWLSLPDTAVDSSHLAHIRNKRMHGDSIENTQTECGDCHRKYHNYGPSMEKPVPAKV